MMNFKRIALVTGTLGALCIAAAFGVAAANARPAAAGTGGATEGRSTSGKRAADVAINLPGFSLEIDGRGRVRMEHDGIELLDVNAGDWENIQAEGGRNISASLGVARPTSPVDIERELPAAGLGALHATTAIADIRLVAGKGSAVKARLHGRVDAAYADGLALEAERTGDEASFTVKAPRQLYVQGDEGLVLDIELPGSARADIRLSSATGNLELADLAFRSAELASETGNLVVKGARGTTLAMRSSTGNLSLDLASGAGCSWSAETETGTIDAPAVRVGGRASGRIGDGAMRAKLESATGNITIRS